MPPALTITGVTRPDRRKPELHLVEATDPSGAVFSLQVLSDGDAAAIRAHALTEPIARWRAQGESDAAYAERLGRIP